MFLGGGTGNFVVSIFNGVGSFNFIRIIGLVRGVLPLALDCVVGRVGFVIGWCLFLCGVVVGLGR